MGWSGATPPTMKTSLPGVVTHSIATIVGAIPPGPGPLVGPVVGPPVGPEVGPKKINILLARQSLDDTFHQIGINGSVYVWSNCRL